MYLRIVVTLGLVIGSIPVQAASPRKFGQAGGFHVVGIPSQGDEHGMCVATRNYERPSGTQTSLARSIDESIRDFVWLAVTNPKWSAKDGKTYEMGYYFDEGHYEREAVGDVTDKDRNGFMSGFPAAEFLEQYSKSRAMQIYLGEARVAELSLRGSFAGMDVFEKCWEWLGKTEKEARKQKPHRDDHHNDPFAEDFSDTFKAYSAPEKSDSKNSGTEKGAPDKAE